MCWHTVYHFYENSLMKRYTTIFFLLVSFFAKAQDADSTASLSLEKCIGFALHNNADINNADFQSQINAVNYTQAKAQVFPSLNANVSHYLNSGRSINPSNNGYSTQSFTSADYGLSAGITLWNGFRLQNYIRKTELDKKAARMDLQNQRDMVTLQVIVAYLDVLNQEDQLDNYKQQLLSTQSQLNRLDSMDIAGAAKPDDIASMRGQLNGNQLSIIQQQDAIKTAKNTLFALMNVPVNPDAVLDRPQSLTEIQLQPRQALEDIFNRSLTTLPLIKEQELKEQSAYKYIQVQKGNYYPTLSFGAGISTNYSSTALDNTGSKLGYFNQLKNNYGTSLGLTLNIPLFNGLQARSNVKIAKIGYNQAVFNTRMIKNQLKNNISQYMADVDAALQSWQKQQEQVIAYQELVRVDQIKFNAGALDATDFLVAKTQLQQAEINLIVQRYTYLFKSKILSYYEGDLNL